MLTGGVPVCWQTRVFPQAKVPVWCLFLGQTSNFVATATSDVILCFSCVFTSTSTSCQTRESPTHSFAQASTPWILGQIQLLIQENICSWSSTCTACIQFVALVSSLVLHSLALCLRFPHLKHKPFFIISAFVICTNNRPGDSSSACLHHFFASIFLCVPSWNNIIICKAVSTSSGYFSVPKA